MERFLKWEYVANLAVIGRIKRLGVDSDANGSLRQEQQVCTCLCFLFSVKVQKLQSQLFRGGKLAMAWSDGLNLVMALFYEQMTNI